MMELELQGFHTDEDEDRRFDRVHTTDKPSDMAVRSKD